MRTRLFDLAITGNILFEGQLVLGGTLLVNKGRVSGKEIQSHLFPMGLNYFLAFKCNLLHN